MFRKNTSHLQSSLFGIESQLSEVKLNKLRESKEYAFYRLVFRRVKEEDFAVLYSDTYSRPNTPVNSLAASIILMHRNNWTTEQLFNRIDFDLLTRTALGLGSETLDETPFCPATFFNFQNRVLEHFTIVEDKVQVRPNEELNGGILQSPDDIDATYRKKRGKDYRGEVVNVTETANPENVVNLLTDVAVCSNDTDDAYGSEDNDKKMEELEIAHVQTAVRGRKAEVAMKIEERPDGEYTVRCPHQCISSQKARKRHKACFDLEICKQCPLSKQCPTERQSKARVYYFDKADYPLGKRNRNIESLPLERRRLRPNVETTVKEFTKPLNHKGKLKVRGLFETMLYAYAMSISINFGRIYRYLAENPGLLASLCSIRTLLLALFGRYIRSELRGTIIGAKSYCLACPEMYFSQAA